MAEDQEGSVACWYSLSRIEQDLVSLDWGVGKVPELGSSPALDKGLTDLVSDLERETDRCERGDDRAVSVHGSTREEVAAFKDAETVVGLGPLFGEVHQFGQVGLSDADIVPCPCRHLRGWAVESPAAL